MRETQIRNDGKGTTDTETGAAVFYCSGSRGLWKRGDGQGGYLERGYWRKQGQSLKGPFSNRETADW